MSLPLKADRPSSSEESGKPTELQPGAYALIVSRNGEIEVAIPRSTKTIGDNDRTTEAMILFALAEKLTDEAWVDGLLAEYWERSAR